MKFYKCYTLQILFQIVPFKLLALHLHCIRISFTPDNQMILTLTDVVQLVQDQWPLDSGGTKPTYS